MSNVTDPTYLKFCGQKLIEMYKWKREDIFKFLHSVCTAEPLLTLYMQFLSLCPLDKPVPAGWQVEHNYQPLNGRGKSDTAYRPDQHIYRIPTRDPRPILSKFDVNLNSTWQHTNPVDIPGLQTPLASPFYWNHYDLLGLILSLVQTELEGADKDRFFLPLTALYGAGAAPAGLECTWVKDKEDKIYFALGSSLAGFDWNAEGQVGKWKIRLRHTCFELLTGWNYIEKVEEKWYFQWSPLLGDKPKAGTHFGNCGETYLFLHMFDFWTSNWRGKVHGLALSSGFLGDPVLKDNSSPKAMHQPTDKDKTKCRFIVDPCENCKYLIGRAGGKDVQFIYQPVSGT